MDVFTLFVFRFLVEIAFIIIGRPQVRNKLLDPIEHRVLLAILTNSMLMKFNSISKKPESGWPLALESAGNQNSPGNVKN